MEPIKSNIIASCPMDIDSYPIEEFPLFTLPVELVDRIMDFVLLTELFSLRGTCHYFKENTQQKIVDRLNSDKCIPWNVQINIFNILRVLDSENRSLVRRIMVSYGTCRRYSCESGRK